MFHIRYAKGTGEYHGNHAQYDFEAGYAGIKSTHKRSKGRGLPLQG